MIPQEEWLHHAKRLAVGAKRRVQHSCGRTPSMDVYNTAEAWRCWCFRCHEGGSVQKEHQSIRVQHESTQYIQPVSADAVPVLQASTYDQSRVWQLLISKGCPPGVIPEEYVWFSKSVQRVLLKQGAVAAGRALSAAQQPKWLLYGSRPDLWFTRFTMNRTIVLTEDVLSAYKVAKASCVYAVPVDVAATMGTSLSTRQLNTVVSQYDTVLCAYDGDAAGAAGAAAMRKRLAVFGTKFRDIRPVTGDPKMQSLGELYGLINTACTT